jgi:hypothetical protein
LNSRKAPRWLASLVLCVVGFSTVIGRAYTALGTGTADSRLFRYIGAQWRDGLLPYRDIWDNKPPGIFVLARVVEGAREPLFVWAAIEAVFVIGIAWCVYLFLKTLRTSPWSRWFGVIAVGLSLNLGSLHHGDLPTELLLALPASAAAFAFVGAMGGASRRLQLYFIGGLLTGIATLFKTPGLAPILALTATFVLDPSQLLRHPRRSARFLGVAYLGFGIAAAVPLAYFAARGAALEMFDATFTYNFHYGVSHPHPITTFATLISSTPIAPLIGLAVPTAARGVYQYVRSVSPGTASISDRRELDPVLLFLVLWFAADFAGAMGGGRAYPHYLIAIIPSATILAALSLEWVLRNALNWQVPAAVVPACALYSLLLGTISDLRTVWSRRRDEGESYFAASARLIRRVACPGDRLFSWDYLPGIAQATNLRPATVLASAHYLNDSPYAVKKFRARVLDDLLKSPPEFVVMLVQTRDPHPSEAVQSLRVALQDLLDRSYTEDRSNLSDHVVEVFIRKDHHCRFGGQPWSRGRDPYK